jgi:hypothetical protein
MKYPYKKVAGFYHRKIPATKKSPVSESRNTPDFFAFYVSRLVGFTIARSMQSTPIKVACPLKLCIYVMNMTDYYTVL